MTVLQELNKNLKEHILHLVKDLTLNDVVAIFETLYLDKEKQQIIEAFDKGRSTCYSSNSDVAFMISEQYYNTLTTKE